MLQKKHLSFSSLRKIISQRVLQIEDSRQKAKINHAIHDCCLSAFAMMFFQDPSMLEFQTRLQDLHHSNNLKTMFDVNTIPKATQLRDTIDIIPSESFYPIFSDYFRSLQRAKQLEQFRFIDNMYLIPIDGTQYFSSKNISCSKCLIKNHKNGDITYSHQVLGVSIVHPGIRQVIPLAPEPIHNNDGNSKQDCERNAGKRLVKRIRGDHPKLKIIIGGDDLYSNQPFLDTLKENRMSFILIAKPSDHVYLFDCLTALKQQGKTNKIESVDSKGCCHIYEWVNGIPLNGSKTADDVNFVEYTSISDGKVIFYNSWVTDLLINEMNVQTIVKGGRSRWKIENENFNTLKNHGYNAKHNFGHGKAHASYNFFLFILLAFFAHQILELTDPLFQQCRAKFSAKKEYWNQLRCTIRILIFSSWQHLLQFIISPPDDLAPP